MKVRITNNNDFRSLESYTVIASGLDENKNQFFLVATDDFQISKFHIEDVEIIDSNTTNYIRRDELNFGRSFLLEDEMNALYRNTHTYTSFNNRKLNYKYFESKNYPISVWYKRHVVEDEIKINRIDGFLMAINLFLEQKCKKSAFTDVLFFHKKKSIDYLLEQKIKDELIYDVNSYENLLKIFLSSIIYEETNPVISSKYIASLYELIDAIFMKEIKSLQQIETYDQDCFIIEYQDSYYIVEKCWWA